MLLVAFLVVLLLISLMTSEFARWYADCGSYPSRDPIRYSVALNCDA
jgi:hypothetical protein